MRYLIESQTHTEISKGCGTRNRYSKYIVHTVRDYESKTVTSYIAGRSNFDLRKFKKENKGNFEHIVSKRNLNNNLHAFATFWAINGKKFPLLQGE